MAMTKLGSIEAITKGPTPRQALLHAETRWPTFLHEPLLRCAVLRRCRGDADGGWSDGERSTMANNFLRRGH
jgi:hypothetical protein